MSLGPWAFRGPWRRGPTNSSNCSIANPASEYLRPDSLTRYPVSVGPRATAHRHGIFTDDRKFFFLWREGPG